MTTTVAPTCEPPKVYTECRPLCEEKCHSLGKCESATGKRELDCIPGCQCPNGTVWDGKTCLSTEQCPCKDQNGVIQPVT